MTLPDIFKVRAFWEALSYLVAGVLGIGFLLGWVPASWVIAPAALLSLFLTVLKWFDIEPQLRLMRKIAQMEKDLYQLYLTKSAKKSVK